MVYVGTEGGVFKTADAGLHWTALAAIGRCSVHDTRALVVDASAPSRLYAGTSCGLRRTSDGGATWTDVSPGGAPREIAALAIRPYAPNVVYAAIESGILRSEDAGQTWTSMGAVPGDVQVLAVHPSDGALYAGTGDAGVFKATDGGRTWQPANVGLTSMDIHALTFDPVTVETLYAATGAGVFGSRNGGSTWTNLGLPASHFVALAVDRRGGVIYALGRTDPFGSEFFRSADDGRTWTGLELPPIRSFRGFSLAVDPDVPDVVYVGTAAHGIYKSADGGRSWSAANDGLNAAWIEGLAVGFNSRRLFAGVVFGPAQSSDDGGASWAPLMLDDVVPLSDVRSFAVSPGPAHTVYAQTLGQVFRSADEGLSWPVFRSVGVAPNALRKVAVDPHDPMTAYVGGDNMGVFKTANGGASWLVVNDGLGDPPPSTWDFAFDPVASGTVYAVVLGRVYKTTDGARTWKLLADVPDVIALAVDPSTPDTLYAALWTGGIAVSKSTDGGERWSPASAGLSVAVKALAIDVGDPNTIYALTHDAGVYVSRDAATTWWPLSRGLPPGIVMTALAVDPDSPGTVFVGTLGRGVFAIVQRCGDGRPDPYETCDDGNTRRGDGCRPDCTAERPGDGILDSGEECDDGNVTDGDCCSAVGTFERAGTVCGTSDDVCVDLICDDTGSCGSVHSTAACDDGDSCTSIDRCEEGFCIGSMFGVRDFACSLDQLLLAPCQDEVLPSRLERGIRRRVYRTERLLHRAERALGRNDAALSERLQYDAAVVLERVRSLAARAQQARKGHRRISADCRDTIDALATERVRFIEALVF
jgi:cysteine-rich repeat protein